MSNIVSLFLAAAAEAGDKPLLIERGAVALRYDELEPETARIAAHLRTLGATPGDRILVQVDKSVTAVLLYLAALRAGLIYVPLNSDYTAEELRHFVADAEPRLLVCTPEALAALEPIATANGAAALTLAADGSGSLLERMADARLPVEPRADGDLACILYTSGTTGRSKGAMLSHANLASNALTLKQEWRWSADDVLVHALPIYHVHGLFVALHGALLAGATMLFHARFDPQAILADLPRATLFMGVPTHYTRLLDQPGLDRETCRTMRLFVSGSAPLLPETHARFTDRTGHTILERYGMTETGMITSNPYDGERIAGTVGYPLPGIAVRIANAEGSELPTGETGVLEVRGPNVFQGYWRMPEKTREEFRGDGFFITGDMATADVDGRVTLVGRAKDLIISGGLNVYPKEIELLIDALPGIGESAVIGVPHPDFGEAVVAVATGTAVDEAAVLAALEGQLARFKRPKRVLLVDALPRNAMGKVQKAELRRRYADLFAAG